MTAIKPVRKPFLVAMVFCLLGGVAFSAEPARSSAGAVFLLTLKGPVDPISARYLSRGIARANADNDRLVVIALDTPGGLESSMDQIVQAILSSEIPVAVFVSPRGARAASAGVFLAMAAHVSAMAPGTHIGAAHPVASGGADIPGDAGRKVLNDAVARLKSIAQMRGRSTEWADAAVRNSESLTDSEAVAARVVDLAAPDLAGLLSAIEDRTVRTAAGDKVLHTSGAAIDRFDMGVIERLLSILVNPDLAYVLLVVGIFGIIFELSAPGFGAPGIAGGIAIILSMVGFGSLPTNLGGAIFIVIAVVLFVVDLFVPSHGIWTAGGIVSFVLGSFLLFPPWRPPAFPAAQETGISPVTIVMMTALVVLFFTFVIFKGVMAQGRKVSVGSEALEGASGEAVTDLAPDGLVRVAGEAWSARSVGGSIRAGEAVEVTGREGLRLTVRRKSSSINESQGGFGK